MAENVVGNRLQDPNGQPNYLQYFTNEMDPEGKWNNFLNVLSHPHFL